MKIVKAVKLMAPSCLIMALSVAIIGASTRLFMMAGFERNFAYYTTGCHGRMIAFIRAYPAIHEQELLWIPNLIKP